MCNENEFCSAFLSAKYRLISFSVSHWIRLWDSTFQLLRFWASSPSLPLLKNQGILSVSGAWLKGLHDIYPDHLTSSLSKPSGPFEEGWLFPSSLHTQCWVFMTAPEQWQERATTMVAKGQILPSSPPSVTYIIFETRNCWHITSACNDNQMLAHSQRTLRARLWEGSQRVLLFQNSQPLKSTGWALPGRPPPCIPLPASSFPLLGI